MKLLEIAMNRCATCKHWLGGHPLEAPNLPHQEGRAECLLLNKPHPLAMVVADSDAEVMVAADFGCVLHEAR